MKTASQGIYAVAAIAFLILVMAYITTLASRPANISLGRATVAVSGINISLADFPAPFSKDGKTNVEIVLQDNPSAKDIENADSIKNLIPGSLTPVKSSEASKTKHVVMIGSPCTNTYMRVWWGLSQAECKDGLKDNESLLLLEEDQGQAGLSIASLSSDEISKAVTVLSDPKKYPLRGLVASVIGPASNISIEQECQGGISPNRCVDANTSKAAFCYLGNLIKACQFCGCAQGLVCPGAFKDCIAENQSTIISVKNETIELSQATELPINTSYSKTFSPGLSGFSIPLRQIVNLERDGANLGSITIYSFDPALRPPWRLFRPGVPSDLTTLTPNVGYLIQTQETVKVTFPLSENVNTTAFNATIASGSYLIAVTGNQSRQLSSTIPANSNITVTELTLLGTDEISTLKPSENPLLEPGKAYAATITNPKRGSGTGSLAFVLPEFHQVYGVVAPSLNSGSLRFKVVNETLDASITQGTFGYSPNIIKLNGNFNDFVNIFFNNQPILNESFKKRGLSFLTVRLPGTIIPQNTLLGKAPQGLTAMLDDHPITEQNITGTHTLTIGKPNQLPLLVLRFDFSSASLNLSQLIFEEKETGRGSGSISGLNLPPGTTKALRIPQTAGGKEVCILDQDAANASTISRDCSGASEVRLFCDGVFNFGYRCILEEGAYFIQGLKHSAVAEIIPTQGSLGTQGSTNQTQGSTSRTPHQQLRNITIQKYRINLTQEPQTFLLDLRDAIEFTVTGERILIIHTATGNNTASFKALPSGLILDIDMDKTQTFELTKDTTPDIAMHLHQIYFDNVSVSFSKPTEEIDEILAKQTPTQELPLQPSPPPTPQASPQTPPPTSKRNEIITSIEPLTSGKEQQHVPVQTKSNQQQKASTKQATQPAIEQPALTPATTTTLSLASALAFAKLHPWVIPSLAVTLAIIAAIISYAAYLLIKELHAIKEITNYITQSLGLGFPLGQIIDALKKQGWSQAHIGKSLTSVAKHYAKISTSQGKPIQAIRVELEGKGWPKEVVQKIT